MKRFLKSIVASMLVATVSYAAETAKEHALEQSKLYPITLEVVNESYSDLAASWHYLQYGPNDKMPVPKMGTSTTIVVNWGGFTHKDFNDYWDTGWNDSDGNWWRPSGSLHLWFPHGEFNRYGKSGICLFEPGLNFDVKGAKKGERKEFTRDHNKVIIRLGEVSKGHPKLILEYLTA